MTGAGRVPRRVAARVAGHRRLGDARLEAVHVAARRDVARVARVGRAAWGRAALVVLVVLVVVVSLWGKVYI